MSNVITPTKEQFLEGKVTFSGIEKEENVINLTPTILKSEYLAGGFVGDDDTYIVLSHNRDIWAGELTDEVIFKMLRDPEIYKCFNVVRNGVLGDGLSFRAALNAPTAIDKPLEGEEESPERRKERLARDEQIERYNLAKKYADFTTRAFDNLNTSLPLRDVLDDMLLALPYGNRVAEKVFEYKYDREFGKKLLYFKHLKVKPRKATIFVVDRFKNVIGFRTYVKVKNEDGVESLNQEL